MGRERWKIMFISISMNCNNLKNDQLLMNYT